MPTHDLDRIDHSVLYATDMDATAATYEGLHGYSFGCSDVAVTEKRLRAAGLSSSGVLPLPLGRVEIVAVSAFREMLREEPVPALPYMAGQTLAVRDVNAARSPASGTSR
ncbi:hypothetical protein [Nonomuraea sp. NPDC049141]|uniref:hypothetical protein n=1 Tax=Nonomuraea sp. NPDC049141 TaxID=3155500 RepID=UPI0033E660C9